MSSNLGINVDSYLCYYVRYFRGFEKKWKWWENRVLDFKSAVRSKCKSFYSISQELAEDQKKIVMTKSEQIAENI